tara:strand:- start:843 stop:1763 length:921 start_codon:yes stop_codon:yes gene_type:complete
MYKFLSMIIIITIAIFSANSFAISSALIEFGNNPGELSASYFQGAKKNKNLIVLLHGCVQQGETLAEQTGLMALAKKKKFSLLIPQQSQNNNIKGCFNWFSTQDIEKNQGESLSIKNMISTVNAKQNFSNIYIIGLSAGGAMASSMVVNYPELFTAGAIVAGIPYPCADNLITAIACMRSGPSQTTEQLTTLIKQLNKIQPHWPALSIFTGDTDAVVNPKNSQHLAIHWAQLTESVQQPIISKYQGYQVSQWHGKNKQINVELIEIENMGHGITVAPEKTDGGIEAPFVISAPFSTVQYLIAAWKI